MSLLTHRSDCVPKVPFPYLDKWKNKIQNFILNPCTESSIQFSLLK